MRIAIIQDELVRKGGAERVVLAFHKAFPEAPIYTLTFNPKLTYPEFSNATVHSSWFRRIAKDEHTLKKRFFPLGLFAMARHDFTGYDVLLISSTHVAKYVKAPENCLVITYCHSPFRLAWYPESYSQFRDSSPLKKLAFKLVISILKKIDFKKARRADYFIANSKETSLKIKDAYNWDQAIEIINPPVVCSNFHVEEGAGKFYLVVSRLEYYKRVDIAVKAFNKLGYPLVVVGKGSNSQKLKEMAADNITFEENVNSEKLAGLYASAKALIFPQHEDYGITPLEANAAGVPVIAYGKGGVLETMIPYHEDQQQATALFFDKQEEESLLEAINKFEKLNFDKGFIRAHAEKFDEGGFIQKVKEFVQQRYNEHASRAQANT